MLTKFLFTKELLEMVMFTCAVLGIMHTVSWYILANTVKDLTETSLLVSKSAPTINQEIRQTNALIRALVASGSEYEPLTPRIAELIKHIPPEIRLTNLTFDRRANRCLLNGVAKTRQDLLSFYETLKEISWLKSPPSPTSQLFEKENVSFQIDAALIDFPTVSAAALQSAQFSFVP